MSLELLALDDAWAGMESSITRGFGYSRSSEAAAYTSSPSITHPERLAHRPEQLSELFFEGVAASNPSRLIAAIIAGEMDAADTALAAEVLGRSVRSELAANLLVALLGHGSAIVREGAIYGLAHVGGDLRAIRDALRRRTRPDVEPSVAVREVAAETLAFLAE